MKLVTFVPPDNAQAAPRLGVLHSDGRTIVALQDAAQVQEGNAQAAFASMQALLDGGARALDAAREVSCRAFTAGCAAALFQLERCRLLAPLPRPLSIRDCMAFEQHIVQAMRAVARKRCPLFAGVDRLLRACGARGIICAPQVWYEQPVYYKSNACSVVGPDADVCWPACTQKLDYELEFGVVIGRQGKNISASSARSHIAGFTIFNDFSARDVQLREMQGRLGPAKGKDFDTGNVLGPWLVTTDEVRDPYRLAMTARVNGELWSQGTSADMHFSFEEIIAYISRDETLFPGEFIGSGTVGGGCGLELGRFLAPGDVVELAVEGLGVLRNRVVRGDT